MIQWSFTYPFTHQILIEHLLCSKQETKQSPLPSCVLYSYEEDKKQIHKIICMCVRKLRHPERIESNRDVFKNCTKNTCQKKLLLKIDLNKRKKKWNIWVKNFPNKTQQMQRPWDGDISATFQKYLECSEVGWREVREVASCHIELYRL